MNIRRLRLITGLTLFTYVGTHLLNHTLGNISIPAMEAGLLVQKFIWQGVLGTAALYVALTTHFLLGLWAFYQRRHFGWTRAEVTQLALGLTIPVLLMNHLWVTRLSLALYGTQKGYAQELYSFWIALPWFGAVQVAVLIVAWSHGCIGVYFWLRLKRFFGRAMPYLVCAAVMLPCLALLGFFQGGRTLLELSQDPAWRAANLNPWQVGTPAENAALVWDRDASLIAYLATLLLVVAARLLRAWRERRGGAVVVLYPDGSMSRVPMGFSILEASRAAQVPHASICGGRGRCSTCRVRIVAGAEHLPAPSEAEQALLTRVRAGPMVRLACQTRPLGDVSVSPLLPAQFPHQAVRQRDFPAPGEERFVVVLMVDMRNSTRLAETRLPYDAVFVVDRFVTTVGNAVVSCGGRVNHFLGDGLMATFGLACEAPQACRNAVACLAAIGRNVDALNRVMLAEEEEPIRFGIGAHCGTAVVGEIGHGATRVFTTLGDAANVAARLEQLCKTYACEAVLSDLLCTASGLDLSDLPLHEAELRGRAAPLAVRTIPWVSDLEAALDSWMANQMV